MSAVVAQRVATSAPLLVYFSSVSGNTARFIEKLGKRAVRIPLHVGGPNPDPPLRVDEPYILVTPTYGGVRGGASRRARFPSR